MKATALLAFTFLAACHAEQQPSPAVPTVSSVSSASTQAAVTPEPPATPSPEVLKILCAAEHVDGTSKVFIGRDAKGAIVRYEVNASRNIPDMGNLIFDQAGKFLGYGRGGELPWNDAEAMRRIEAKEKELEAGATFVEGPSCPAR